MANIKISALTAAGAVTGGQEFEVADTGSSLKVTGAQIASYVEGTLGTIATQDANSVTITGGSVSGITDLAIADGGTGASTSTGAINNLLPTQSGNNGKFLSTDGSAVSWQSSNITDGDKGDITVTSAGSVWTVDTGAITTTKIADANVTGTKLENSGVTAAIYGSSTQIPVVTVDAKGRITSATVANVSNTGALIGVTVYDSSSTYAKATNNPSFIIVEVTGGGGAGGHGGSTSASAAPGTGGGYAMKKILASALASSETVTVGTAVSGRTTQGTGASGNTSSFGTHCSATGGAGGTGNTVSLTGVNAGGVGSGGDVNYNGESRTQSSATLPIYANGGGSKANPSGGISSFNKDTSATAGTFGAGGGAYTATDSGSSGAGGAGQVIVWEYK